MTAICDIYNMFFDNLGQGSFFLINVLFRQFDLDKIIDLE